MGIEFRSLSSIAAITVALAASPAIAQAAGGMPANDQQASGDDVQEIVVTGSYIRRSTANQTALEVIDADDLAKTSKANVAEILANIPASLGSSIFSEPNSVGSNVSASINLRGLGPRATLVLVNGQRQVPLAINGGIDDFAVDINTLVPSVLLSRIDILKDGASALYGSDAVAGVVNFVTRDDLDGVVFEASTTVADANGSWSPRFGIGFGSQGERTSIVIGAEYSRQHEVFVEDVVSYEDRLKFGQSSGFGNPATFVINGVSMPDPLCGSPLLGGPLEAGRVVNGVCRADLTGNRTIIPTLSRAIGFASVSHEATDGITLNAEFSASRLDVDRTSGVGFPAFSPSLTVPASNPGNIFGEDALVMMRIGRLYVDDPAEDFNMDVRSDWFRGKLSADIELADAWNLTVGASYQVNQSNTRTYGQWHIGRLQQALNCQGGPSGNMCFNPFASSFLAPAGSSLANSEEVLEWMRVTPLDDDRFTLETYDALLTGELFELPGGPVSVAIGAQHRKEYATSTVDDATRQRMLTFNLPKPEYSIGRKTNAIFSEVLVPLLTTLDISAAARYEKSNPGKGTFNPKLGFSFRPLRGIDVNGSIGRSERAPGLLQYIGGSDIGRTPLDPITGSNAPAFPVTFLPSVDLKSESAITWNLGVRGNQSTSFGRIQFDVNYWSINFKDLIVAFDVTRLIETDPLNPAIERAPGTGTDRFIVSATVPGFANANRLKLNGIDFSGRVGFDAGAGELFVSTDGTLMTKYDFTTVNGTQALLGKYNTNPNLTHLPKFSARLTAGYTSDLFSLSATLNHVSKLRETQAPLIGITEERAYEYLDVNASYSLTPDITLAAGVGNLFNDLPPFQGNNQLVYNGTAYPTYGRTFKLSVRAAF